MTEVRKTGAAAPLGPECAELARELHDELGAILMGAKLDVACLVPQLGGRSGALAQGTSISAVLPCEDAAPTDHAVRPTHH